MRIPAAPSAVVASGKLPRDNEQQHTFQVKENSRLITRPLSVSNTPLHVQGTQQLMPASNDHELLQKAVHTLNGPLFEFPGKIRAVLIDMCGHVCAASHIHKLGAVLLPVVLFLHVNDRQVQPAASALHTRQHCLADTEG